MKFRCRLRLLLVRHGQAEGNQHGVFLGRSDAELTEVGLEQVRFLAEKLADEEITQIYTSPLLRAHKTASVLARAHGLEPALDARLVEQDFGRWDGLRFKQVKETFSEGLRAWADGGPEIAPNGGEALKAVAERVASFLADLQHYREGETVLVVSHAATLQTLICLLLETPLRNLWAYRIQGGSLTEIELFDYGAALVRMSCHMLP